VEEMKSEQKCLVGRPEVKKPLETARRKCEDNIKMGLKEIVCEGVNWIQLTQDRIQCQILVNTATNTRVA
jgi:hypothetical protein